MRKWTLYGKIGLVAVLLSSSLLLAKGGKEDRFTMWIRAYDTTIPEATIEGVTIKNVRQFNVINEPDTFLTRVGNKVVLKVVNESPISENVSVEDQQVDETLKAKETKELRFTPKKAGSYTIWCKLHPKNVHLPGTLIVQE
jgi:nitrosocyanin